MTNLFDAPHSHDRQPTAHLADPGDLIAAVPALLGFVPHRSLLLICLDGPGTRTPTIGTVMRHDLTLPTGGRGSKRWLAAVTPDMLEVSERYAVVCERERVEAAIGVIVDDRAESSVSGGMVDSRFRALSRVLADVLTSRGVDLPRMYLTADIARGSAYVTITGRAIRGTLPDPALSPLALGRVVEGRPVLESRVALERVLEPSDRIFEADVARCLSRIREMPSDSDRHRIERILGYVDSWASEPPDAPADVTLSEDICAEFGAALTSLMVRDSMLALVLTDRAGIAEDLWSFLTRYLPAPEKACAATLLAFSAYARGHGALATIAVDIALDADPDYSLARLLDRSLLAAARPDMIREVALSGYSVAELCGVRLPAPQD